jgi:hypothetical protein
MSTSQLTLTVYTNDERSCTEEPIDALPPGHSIKFEVLDDLPGTLVITRSEGSVVHDIERRIIGPRSFIGVYVEPEGHIVRTVKTEGYANIEQTEEGLGSDGVEETPEDSRTYSQADQVAYHIGQRARQEYETEAQTDYEDSDVSDDNFFVSDDESGSGDHSGSGDDFASGDETDGA